MKHRELLRHSLIGMMTATVMSITNSAQSASAWTDWTSSTVDPAALDAFGTATGTLGAITVTYSGELDGGYRINGDGFAPGTSTSVWAPESTYIGGAVTSSPVSINDYLRIDGFPEDGHVNTITFSSPVTNPLIAIWSLGDPTRTASMTFDAIPLFQA